MTPQKGTCTRRKYAGHLPVAPSRVHCVLALPLTTDRLLEEAVHLQLVIVWNRLAGSEGLHGGRDLFKLLLQRNGWVT